MAQKYSLSFIGEVNFVISEKDILEIIPEGMVQLEVSLYLSVFVG